MQDKCIVRIERLAELGHQLRRPEADFLRDGVSALRTSFQTVNYRMLYFFYQQTAVISHGLTKEKQVPDREIELAILHRKLFERTQLNLRTRSPTMNKTRKTSNAVRILHRRYIGEDVQRKASLEQERVNAEVARTIYELREQAGLSQKELAERVDTTQSVISRLEDADYEGHSLSMFNRIAKALNQQVQVVMRPKERDLERSDWSSVK